MRGDHAAPTVRRTPAPATYEAYVRKLSQVQLFPNHVHIHIFGKKSDDKWSLTFVRGTRIVVVADSVFRPISALPTGWEVQVYTGAILQDTARLLSAVQEDQCRTVERIIVYMGVNNRGDNPDTIRRQAREVMGQAIRLEKKLTFCLLPVSDAMSIGFQDKI